ncbi:MAG: ATP-dependent zinc metalloprotease FtsH [Crocinitomicaceae bacterium]|nr:ATP-dependent zinc metalloprotease FtsH [Crocinitomicaceae bacterium]MDP4724524.1 ATP-dependent zinc metalloprotease FtsH [Crocinitomicaceae bacterium]MDP4739119.1 ATP-dependent zinc metalloprotease FtsH [Crocinitomicaceae bacterium]MDP4799800.1 ATP-dependent zinc metalloprotease FtsH [Crocinitomicaceae bacterium]MDP4806160.1 ATP-dependent zinc metalloprotease FtsH [Crocinitomicaceae bacterium]
MSEEKRKNPFSVYWIYIAFVLVLVSTHLYINSETTTTIKYKETLLDLVEAKGVKQVKIVNQSTARFQLRKSATTYINSRKDLDFPKLRKLLANKNAQPSKIVFELENIGNHANFEKALDERGYHDYENVIETNWIAQILGYLLPFGIIVLIWMFVMRRMSGGGGGGGGGGQIFNIGKSRAQVYEKGKSTNITFKDVAGLEGAKEEIVEIVEFLKNPKKYTELGAKIPKGALLVGPPGTGKTLLAKAVAGEAKVPFFSLSGSDFVEMFVGVGASRVRDLFRQAKEKAPAIIFIDEIDAIGRARGKNNGFNTNDERENTLNQLLTEMDGFGTNSGVIILAATNRADVLDSALMRAGRFDRQIYVDMPDLNERRAIFGVHLKPLKLSTEIDVEFLAKQTPGFSGADIANLCNEAALIAARHNKTQVEKQDFLDAVDRIIGGLEKKNKIITPEEKKTIAYHEAGHAAVSWLLQYANPLVKVTIVPRGQSLGAAWYLPEERSITTTEQLLDDMCATLGGRAAEQLTFKRISTGALSDLERVTKQAYAMTSIYGLNERVGNISFYDSQGRDAFTKPYSEDTAKVIDEEVSKLIEGQYKRALLLLGENQDKLGQLADRLLTSEVIFKEDLEAIFGKRPWDPIEEIPTEIEQATIESNPDNMLETGEETEPTANA